MICVEGGRTSAGITFSSRPVIASTNAIQKFLSYAISLQSDSYGSDCALHRTKHIRLARLLLLSRLLTFKNEII